MLKLWAADSISVYQVSTKIIHYHLTNKEVSQNLSNNIQIIFTCCLLKQIQQITSIKYLLCIQTCESVTFASCDDDVMLLTFS